jgi:hypothetical protein
MCSRLERRSKPASFRNTPPEKDVDGNISLNFPLVGAFQETLLTFGRDENPGHFSSVGAPSARNILAI